MFNSTILDVAIGMTFIYLQQVHRGWFGRQASRAEPGGEVKGSVEL